MQCLHSLMEWHQSYFCCGRNIFLCFKYNILCNSVRKNSSTIFIFINTSILCQFEKLHYPCLATSVALSNSANYVTLLTSKWLMHYVSFFFFPCCAVFIPNHQYIHKYVNSSSQSILESFNHIKKKPCTFQLSLPLIPQSPRSQN